MGSRGIRAAIWTRHNHIEASNLNRLIAATQHDVDEAAAKVDILECTITAVRPYADVKTAKKNWQEADTLIREADVIFGCVDVQRQRPNAATQPATREVSANKLSPF